MSSFQAEQNGKARVGPGALAFDGEATPGEAKASGGAGSPLHTEAQSAVISNLESKVDATSSRVASMQSTLEQLSLNFQAALHQAHHPETSGASSAAQPANAGASQLSQEFRATLESLQRVLSVVAAQHAPVTGATSARPRIMAALRHHAARCLAWTGEAIKNVAAQADDVAVAVAHRILIEPPAVPQEELVAVSKAATEPATKAVHLGRTRVILGAAFFVAVVELAWQLHFRLVERLSARLQKAGAPARAGMRILRGAVWAAAILITARATRRSCFTAADAACTSLHRVLEQRRAQEVKDAEEHAIQDGDFPSGHYPASEADEHESS